VGEWCNFYGPCVVSAGHWGRRGYGARSIFDVEDRGRGGRRGNRPLHVWVGLQRAGSRLGPQAAWWFSWMSPLRGSAPSSPAGAKPCLCWHGCASRSCQLRNVPPRDPGRMARGQRSRGCRPLLTSAGWVLMARAWHGASPPEARGALRSPQVSELRGSRTRGRRAYECPGHFTDGLSAGPRCSRRCTGTTASGSACPLNSRCVESDRDQ
jgi:hypothetical protein